MIHDVKDVPILKETSQEPSMSSKYDFEDVGFLTHFYLCYRAEIWQTSQESYIMMIHDVKDDPILQGPSQDRGFLTHSYSYYRAEILHTIKESYIMMIHDTKDDSILKDSSKEPLTSTKYDF